MTTLPPQLKTASFDDQRLSPETFTNIFMHLYQNYFHRPPEIEMESGKKTSLKAQGDQTTKNILWATLKAYSEKEVRAAALNILNTCQYFPTVADFITRLEPTAEKAWAGVIAAINKYDRMKGRYWPTDAATAKAIKHIGGWHQLSCKTFFEINQLRGAFCEAWAGAAAQGLHRQPGAVRGEIATDSKTGAMLPPACCDETLKHLPYIPPPKRLPAPKVDTAPGPTSQLITDALKQLTNTKRL